MTKARTHIQNISFWQFNYDLTACVWTTFGKKRKTHTQPIASKLQQPNKQSRLFYLLLFHSTEHLQNICLKSKQQKRKKKCAPTNTLWPIRHHKQTKNNTMYKNIQTNCYFECTLSAWKSVCLKVRRFAMYNKAIVHIFYDSSTDLLLFQETQEMKNLLVWDTFCRHFENNADSNIERHVTC